jgi:polar amino acid transport system substrate-binding protein
MLKRFLFASLIFLFLHQAAYAAAAKETAYERVIRTGILRCAYGTWEPGLMQDPNTGKISGIVYDIMQAVGKSINIKVDYTMEVSWDAISIALQTGKADAHCAGMFATPARGRNLAFSDPLFFSPTVAFARADDKRFDNNLEAINNANITVALSDDDITTEIYAHDFPKAKKIKLAQMSAPAELLLTVASKKADVTFNSPNRLKTYEKNNPGKLKIIPTKKPLRIFADVIAVHIHEDALLHMLNTGINNAIDNGTVDKIIKKYAADYDVEYIVPVQRPYSWQ